MVVSNEDQPAPPRPLLPLSNHQGGMGRKATSRRPPAGNSRGGSSDTWSHSAPGSPKHERKSTSSTSVNPFEAVCEAAREAQPSHETRTPYVNDEPTELESGLRHQSSSGSKASCGDLTAHGVSPAVAAAVAAAGDDSESDLEQQHHQTSGNRSRQKKFIKNFKQLPQEEVVLQRYSCALVSDILLQGHLYITENYFAFHSNVFGYVTRLQIPVRSVTKITKEKTAKIIPNAVGVSTEDDVKHIFASLLSRDSTFKLMTSIWKRAIRGAGRTDLMLQASDAHDGGELDDIINESSDSEPPGDETLMPCVSEVNNTLETSYVVKRMSQNNGTLYYQATTAPIMASVAPSSGPADSTALRRSSSLTHGPGAFLGHVSKSSLLSVFVVVLLVFLFCSSLYLVFRIDSLQRQVESRYPKKVEWTSNEADESKEQIQRVLDDNVEQISSVRKSLEKLSHLIHGEEGPAVAAAPVVSSRDET